MKMDVEDSFGIKIKEEAKECLSPTSTTHASTCITGAADASAPASQISHTTASKLTTTTNNNPEPSPVNLNLKPRSKGNNQPSKDRPSEECPPSTTELRPTSPVSLRTSTQSSSISRSSIVHDSQTRTGGSRSSDSSSPLPQGTKIENAESIVGRLLTVNVVHEEASPGSNSNGIGTSAGTASRVPHAKLKRLLGTLVQFASDISPETGDAVRSLVLSLLSGAMTAEEFHGALQEATNFPLRGFVLPYLKHTLPSLQRDLTNAARANNQTSVQYLRSNEAVVLEAAGFSPGEPAEVFGERNNSNATAGGCLFPSYGISTSGNPNSTNPLNSTAAGANNSAGPAPGLHAANQHPNATNLHHYPGPPPPPPTSHSLKRRASDTPYYENGAGPLFEDGPLYGKRAMNPWATHHPIHHQRQQQQQQADAYCWYHPLQLGGGSAASLQSHPQSSMPPSLVQINHLAASSTTSSAPHLVHQQQWGTTSSAAQGSISGLQNGSCPAAAAALDDEWKNIHVMLNCILGMVEKTKRALAILQRRGCPSPAIPVTAVTTSGTNPQNNGPANTGDRSDSAGNERDNSLKRISGEIVAQTIRATEDRVAEVQRRAEEAMLEAKRAAVAEVQRAIAAAAAETRAAERLRVHHHRFFEQPMQRSHGHIPHSHTIGHGPLLRVVDTTTCLTTTATTTATTTTASNASAPREDEKEPQAAPGSSCWNCGRQALETCGGCGIARYCGPFCQHRDWEAGGHHATCNPRRPTPPPPPPLPPPPPPRPASRSPTTSSAGPAGNAGGSSGSTSTTVTTVSGHTGKGK